ncbi:MAG TPA: ABC transporter permease subunit, partial [Gaiellaceae bacterium]
ERRLASSGDVRPEGETLRRPRTARDKVLVGASLGGLAVFLGLPLAVLVERSLAAGDGHGFAAYRALGHDTNVLLAAPWEAVVNSMLYAAAATAIAVVVGGLAAFAVAGRNRHASVSDTERRPFGTRLLDALVLIPLGASAVMLGLGFLIAFDAAPLDFRAEPWLVPVAQALIAIPFVVRILVPTLRSIDPRQREAAALLGATPSRVRREIDLPIVSRGLAVSAGFAFAISLGEFGATVFLARPDRPTLPVAIFSFLGRPGEINVAQAYALAVVLMGVTVVAVLLVERVRVRRGGWF